jgi:hypothetical protein
MTRYIGRRRGSNVGQGASLRAARRGRRLRRGEWLALGPRPQPGTRCKGGARGGRAPSASGRPQPGRRAVRRGGAGRPGGCRWDTFAPLRAIATDGTTGLVLARRLAVCAVCRQPDPRLGHAQKNGLFVGAGGNARQPDAVQRVLAVPFRKGHGRIRVRRHTPAMHKGGRMFPGPGVMINDGWRYRVRRDTRGMAQTRQRREYLPTVQWHLFHSLRGSLNSGLSPSGGFHWRTSQASTVAFTSRLTVARTSPSWRSA